MSISYTKTTLLKIEELFKEYSYRVRYERGNFKSGYCIVNSSSIVIVNKFFDAKARIETLIEILGKIELPNVELTEHSNDILQKISKLDTFERKMVA